MRILEKEIDGDVGNSFDFLNEAQVFWGLCSDSIDYGAPFLYAIWLRSSNNQFSMEEVEI